MCGRCSCIAVVEIVICLVGGELMLVVVLVNLDGVAVVEIVVYLVGGELVLVVVVLVDLE